ncbi:hypothetical protein AB1Y20_005079 [Prymnesium parvum]|uniref:Mitochondrial chaperone BCS1 n=1 Tax=Prymnesium parvum TaxID=97485 RepID=A0AB34J582_PRYPA
MARHLSRGCSSLASSLLANQFATGGVAVLLTGAALAATRTAARAALELALRRCVVRAELDSRDDSYRWVVAWLAAHPSAREARHVTVCTSLRRVGHTPIDADADADEERLLLVPAGTSLLSHAGKWLLVRREEDAERKEREGLSLQLLLGSREQMAALLREAREAYAARARERTRVYFADEYGGWACVASVARRPLDSVVLSPAGAAAAVRDDCARFLARRAWYGARGIPYRRGYLLHGPPGTGKTSLVGALAGELQLPIYSLSLASGRLTDDTLAEALAAAAPRCLLLLEDVDAAFGGREGAGGARLTFSGLLNAIDGVAAQEGRLLFMSTNHLDRLDAALVRPGRVDVRVHLGLCSREQAAAYARRFYDDAAPEHIDAIADAAGEGVVSVADLQGVLMQIPENPERAPAAVAAMVAELGRKPPSDDGNLQEAEEAMGGQDRSKPVVDAPTS